MSGIKSTKPVPSIQIVSDTGILWDVFTDGCHDRPYLWARTDVTFSYINIAPSLQTALQFAKPEVSVLFRQRRWAALRIPTLSQSVSGKRQFLMLMPSLFSVPL